MSIKIEGKLKQVLDEGAQQIIDQSVEQSSVIFDGNTITVAVADTEYSMSRTKKGGEIYAPFQHNGANFIAFF